jgi:hypothetical protein
MEELEEMGAYAEGAPGESSFEPTDNSAAEDSAVHVHPLMTPGLAWKVPCPRLQGDWHAVCKPLCDAKGSLSCTFRLGMSSDHCL